MVALHGVRFANVGQFGHGRYHGVKVETLQDGMVNIRPNDVGFDGASHRAPGQADWHRWADNTPKNGCAPRHFSNC